MAPFTSSAPPFLATPDARVREERIRDGVSLNWGPGAPAPSHLNSADVGARLVFVLTGESDSANERMILTRETDLPSAIHPAIFHATITLTPNALNDLLADDHTPSSRALRAHFNRCFAPPLAFPLTSAARLSVESIRRCPFAGACRTMALAARCNDLLVEFLTAAGAPAPIIARGTEDQIHAAATILRQRLEAPPSLAELAREVGLSETTLKRGFHRVFNTTVFGYLRACRMEHAHALLQSGQTTVLEAAALVGFSNPSNFAAAFRRQFGVNPKTFQLTARR